MIILTIRENNIIQTCQTISIAVMYKSHCQRSQRTKISSKSPTTSKFCSTELWIKSIENIKILLNLLSLLIQALKSVEKYPKTPQDALKLTLELSKSLPLKSPESSSSGSKTSKKSSKNLKNFSIPNIKSKYVNTTNSINTLLSKK
jgi:hypothetical protein